MLLGRNPGAIPRGKTIDKLKMPAVPAGLPSDLLDRRPDIRLAEQELVGANARIGVAKAQYFPSISLTGAFGWSSTQLSNLFSGPARTWNWAAPLYRTDLHGRCLDWTGHISRGGSTAGVIPVSAIGPERLP